MALERVAHRFVGRGDELGRLRSLVTLAAGGEPRVILVSGDAGVGKSTLLSRFARTAVDEIGARVLVGSCLPIGGHGVPFAPFVEIARSLATGSPLDTTPSSGPPSDQRTPLFSESAVRPTVLYQSTLELLGGLAATEPLVVVIEDLHWADGSTLDLFTYLVANFRTEPVLLIASYRTDGLARDHPLRSIVSEWVRSHRVERLPLEPFDRPLVAAQIALLTPSRPTAETVDRVMERTQGNPYFVEELVAADCLDGRPLPASLRELLLVRADVVTPAARRTLRVLSAAADDIDDATLARAADLPVGSVREHVREGLDRRLLVATPTGVRFVHALLREALYDDLLPSERMEYHAAWAAALDESVSTAAPDAGRLAQVAHHRAHGGDIAGATDAWLAASSAAEAICAFAEAHQHLEHVLANWDVVGSGRAGPLAHTDVIARAADNAFLAGRAERARDLVEREIAAVGDRLEPQRLGMLYERLARYVRDTDDPHRVLELVERAVELVPDLPTPDRAIVLAGYATHLMTSGRYADAGRVATSAAEIAQATDAVLAEADARNTLGVVVATTDDVERGLALIREARVLGLRCGDQHQQMRSIWNTVACTFDAGEWERVLDAYRDAVDALPALGLRHLVPELDVIAADVLMRLGRWDQAEATVEESRRRHPENAGDIVLVDLLVERGEEAAARDVIRRRIERNVYMDTEQEGWPLVHLASLETWLGNHDAARAAIDSALAAIGDVDAPIATAHALAIGSRCEADAADDASRRRSAADESAALERAERLVARGRELMTRPGPAAGWKREVGAQVLQCEAEARRARAASDAAAWSAVVDAWNGLQMPYPAAYARFRQAEALLAVGLERPVAGDLLADAHRIATGLGAAPLSEAIEAAVRRAGLRLETGHADDPHGLTPREREVLERLATGATNREIAGSLFISEKTASVHVSNIIRKLGVSNRGQAVATAHRLGLVS